MPGNEVVSVISYVPSGPVTSAGSPPPWRTTAPSTGSSPSVTTPDTGKLSGSSPPAPAPPDAVGPVDDAACEEVAPPAPLAVAPCDGAGSEEQLHAANAHVAMAVARTFPRSVI